MNRASIDDVSPQEWDAYNRKRIQSLKDPDNYNKNGMTDQESLNALDTKMETDILEPEKPYHHQTDHIANVAKQLDDNVNSPSHYNSGAVECIDAIEAMLSPEEYIGYLRGNSLKYRWRFRYKGKPVEDIKKANWYEERLLKFMTEKYDVLGSKSRA
tara:strand:- start:527 stop:997 length:471 start_codon:yes stop_codon:yes gene_type:complete